MNIEAASSSRFELNFHAQLKFQVDLSQDEPPEVDKKQEQKQEEV